MATNVDPKRMEQALRVSGERTTKAAVTKALQDISREAQKRLVDLMGKLECHSSCDYKADRMRD